LHKDQFIGAALLTASLIVVIAYVWLVFFPPLTGADIFMLKLTGTVAVAGVFGILSWIGYTLATTPPPKPIEEIEKEIEKELKEVEGEAPGKPEK
jgi:predicted DNA-binding transcriptional regulator